MIMPFPTALILFVSLSNQESQLVDLFKMLTNYLHLNHTDLQHYEKCATYFEIPNSKEKYGMEANREACR